MRIGSGTGATTILNKRTEHSGHVEVSNAQQGAIARSRAPALTEIGAALPLNQVAGVSQ